MVVVVAVVEEVVADNAKCSPQKKTYLDKKRGAEKRSLDTQSIIIQYQRILTKMSWTNGKSRFFIKLFFSGWILVVFLAVVWLPFQLADIMPSVSF